MKKVMHKANYKDKCPMYCGWGQYALIPISLCGGTKAFWAGKSYEITRNWKNVTCKHCLKKKPVDTNNSNN